MTKKRCRHCRRLFREKQRSRNRLLRTMAAVTRQVAKMDTISAKEHDISGYYGLISVQDLRFAKMDAKFVKIIEVPDSYDQFGTDRKGKKYRYTCLLPTGSLGHFPEPEDTHRFC